MCVVTSQKKKKISFCADLGKYDFSFATGYWLISHKNLDRVKTSP